MISSITNTKESRRLGVSPELEHQRPACASATRSAGKLPTLPHQQNAWCSGWFVLRMLLTFLGMLMVPAQAGIFTSSPWTNDATTGIVNGQTSWAYHFGSTIPAVINGVTVPGLAGPTASNANFDLTGTVAITNNDVNNLTTLVGTGSAIMANDYVLNGNPAVVTVKGLTVGTNYTVSFFSVGYEPGASRSITFTSGSDSQVIAQSQFGSKNGIRADYSFTATASTRTVNLAPNVTSGLAWHMYGLALQTCNNAPVVGVSGNVPGSFSGAAAATSRSGHTATLLADGRVLVSAGISSTVGYLVNAAIYNAGVWTTTASLATARNRHTATLLKSGQVLVVGGYNGGWLSSCELYNPSGMWTAGASLVDGRSDHTATLLCDGRVLVAGGTTTGGTKLANAIIYDPNANTWAAAGSLSTLVSDSATLLPNGKVLVVGGNAATLFDPVTGLWSGAGGLAASRSGHSATLMGNGKVLVVGGQNGSSVLGSGEIYDPATNLWTTAPQPPSMVTARYGHTATLLTNGKVLIAGGNGSNSVLFPLSSAELYDPATNSWASASSMSVTRTSASATRLSTGKVLVVGGLTGSGIGTDVGTAELYDAPSMTSTVPEGIGITKTGNFADPQGNSTVAISASSGSVTQNNVASTWSWSPTSGDGPASTTVTITATDNANATATTVFTCVVSNVAPTVNCTVPTAANVGATVNFAFSATDPSTADVAAGYTWNINFGDGTGTQTFAPLALLPSTHVFATAGTYSVTATATDKDGGVSAICSKSIVISSVVPSVVTTAQSGVTATTAVLGGNVTADGGASVTDRGIVWSTTSILATTPPASAPNKVANGTGLGTFSANASGLPPGSNVCYRAYAINSVGYAYGAEICFTTTATVPTVVTTAQTSVTATTAVLGGNVTFTGGAAVSDRGIVWSTTSILATTAPASAPNRVGNGTGLGTFSGTVSGLPPVTNVCYRAYAINSVGYAYGAEICFTTPAAVPTVVTIAPGNIISNSADLFGAVSVTGGAAVSERGFVYSPTISIPINQVPGAASGTTKSVVGLGIGNYSFSLTGLTVGVQVCYRAYALNSAGYAYGAEFCFTPTGPPAAPVLSPGWSVVTCFSGAAMVGPISSNYVMGQIDTNSSSLPNWDKTNNTPPMYHHTDWTRARMGEVFGVTLDAQTAPNSFVSATSIYNTSHYWTYNQWPANGTLGDTFGTWGKPGGIYCIDGQTGAVGNYAEVPNAGTPLKSATPASLGNLNYDAKRHMIYVSNLDDGKIYKVTWLATCPATPLTATVLWDHGTQGRPVAGLTAITDSGTSGVTAAGRRVWAVHQWQDRLYYSVWNGGSTSKANDASSEIWSVGFDSSGNLVPATTRMEVATGRVVPVSDMMISDTGAMMISERGCIVAPVDIPTMGILAGMIDTNEPHGASIYQYRRNAVLTWVPDKTYSVGKFSTNTNSAGGIDMDCDETILATGNALALGDGEPYAWYGMQVIPAALNPTGNGTNGIQNSHLIDYDGVASVISKSTPGDVALVKHKCPCFKVANQQVACVGNAARWIVTLTNTSGFDISYLSVEGLTAGVTWPGGTAPIIYTPAFLAGETRTLTFEFTMPATPPVEFCFRLKAANALLDQCCDMQFCLRPECCLRLANEQWINTGGATYNYCFDLTNLSGVTATRLVLANTPVGSGCPVFLNPITPLTPPLAHGATRHFCIPVVAAGNCRRLNFVVSLHDANYHTCCSQARSIPWWRIVDVSVESGGVLRPAVDLSTLLLEDYSSIVQVDYLVDGQVARSVTSPPWTLDADLTLTPGVHQLSYVVTTLYGQSIQGPSRDVGGIAGSVPALTLEMNVRSSDRAMVLSWADPAAILQTCTDLAGPWEQVVGATSPYIQTDFSARCRFYRLYRP